MAKDDIAPIGKKTSGEVKYLDSAWKSRVLVVGAGKVVSVVNGAIATSDEEVIACLDGLPEFKRQD
ncbi:Uncharacterized protein ChrSV_1548 [Chromobacterium vaccinii]|nr:Uncharacterized protein ChrSW_1548 [Chromobacterium vaccinii]QND89006.1 Uncharacterized protein ChrSV_1548 [Chromobacterium vaccinii]